MSNDVTFFRLKELWRSYIFCIFATLLKKTERYEVQ